MSTDTHAPIFLKATKPELKRLRKLGKQLRVPKNEADRAMNGAIAKEALQIMSAELDLDDVAAQSPKAKAELAALRSLAAGLVRELNVVRGLLRDDADKDSEEAAEIRRLRSALTDAANSFRAIYSVTGNEAAKMFECDARKALGEQS